MPSLVVIGQQIKERRRGSRMFPHPAYIITKYPSLSRVKIVVQAKFQNVSQHLFTSISCSSETTKGIEGGRSMYFLKALLKTS